MAATKKPAEPKPTTAKQYLELWNSLEKSPPSASKKANVNGQNIHSINGLAMVKAATGAFGPVGIGWGYRIEDERYDDTGPIFEKIFENGQNRRGEKLADGKVHTIRLTVWYKHKGETGEVTHFGHTPYLYGSKYGFTCDMEAPKKSLTDALKKCLSQIGVFADVWLGLYDDPLYVAEQTQAEAQVKKGGALEELKLWAEGEVKKYEACPNKVTLDNYWNGHIGQLQNKAAAHKLSQEDFDTVKAILDKAYFARLEAASVKRQQTTTQGQQGGNNQ